MKAAFPLILIAIFGVVLLSGSPPTPPPHPGESVPMPRVDLDAPAEVITSVDVGNETILQEKVRREVVAALAVQLEKTADAYASAKRAIDEGKFTSLEDVNKAVKPHVAEAHETSFSEHLAPLLEAINGERWDAAKASEGFGAVEATQRKIAEALFEHLRSKAPQ